MAVARLLADYFGSEIDVVNQPRDRFWVEWEKNAATGLETLSHSWGLALAERLNGHETLLDGMNGGVLFGRAGLMRAVLQQFGDIPPSFPALHDFVLNELVSKPHQALESWLPAKFAQPYHAGIAQRGAERVFFQISRLSKPSAGLFAR